MGKVQFYLFTAMIFALAVAIFAVQNTEKMTIYFLFWQIEEVSTVIVVLASAIGGFLVMFCLGFISGYRKTRIIRLLEAELREMKKIVETDNGGKAVGVDDTSNPGVE
ncbi:MAG: LapA family protein [Peptococcaceae bacterium]|nr:LapA family protein [Peptococcaceae bacterium]